jgi:FkbM family methyltransferase
MSLLHFFIPHEMRRHLKRRFLNIQDVQSRLQNLKDAGFTPRGIVDGGAFRGEWIESAWKVWPAPALMLEPQASEQAVLREVAKRTRGTEVVECALGEKNGRVRFVSEGSNSRIVENDEAAEVPLLRLDQILDERPSFHPDLVKLDLQGSELRALEGAGSHLGRFEVILCEISVIRIGPVPIFREVDAFLAARGFVFYDVIPQYYRPRDGALWQMDVFYVREDSPLLASTSWD